MTPREQVQRHMATLEIIATHARELDCHHLALRIERVILEEQRRELAYDQRVMRGYMLSEQEYADVKSGVRR
jgi:hypothetical protein